MQDHAGAPGPAGLPETTAPGRPRWWRTPRHPRLVLAVAMLAALVASAGITVVLTAGGGSHRPLAAGARLGAEPPAPASTAVAASAVPGSTVPASTVPASTVPASTAPSSTSPAPTTTAYLTGPASPPAGASGPASPPGHPTSPPARPSPSSSPSSSPAQGYLQVAPGNLMLTSKAGQPASGFFILTAATGPVAQYTVRVSANGGKVSVAPAAGSLPAGSFVAVTVTVTSKAALTTQLMVEPGNLSVTVVYRPKPTPAPTPAGGGSGG